MTGTDITAYEAKWAAQAAEQAVYEKVKGAQFLSTRSGQLMLGNDAMPGSQVCCIVLDSARLNTYYGDDGRYNESEPKSPICYAFGRKADPLGPHPTMQADLTYFHPMSHACGGPGDPTGHVCPFNEWGSAKQGRGKACQNRRQLMLIPAGYFAPKKGSRDFDLHLFEQVEQFTGSDAVGLRLPVTSVEEWAQYVNLLSTQERRPPEGVITRIYTEPHPKFQFVIKFELIEKIPDALIEVIVRRAEQMQAMPFGGFRVPEEKPQGGFAQGPRRSLRG